MMPRPRDLFRLRDRAARDVGRLLAKTSNGLRHLGEVGRPPMGLTPKSLVWSTDKVSLYRYESSMRRRPNPVLLVMSLVTKPEVFDLRPGNSMVEALLERGHDVWLLDWGVADAVDCDNSFETYCDHYLPLAVGEVAQAAGGESVTLLGYCFGGLLTLLFLAGHSEAPVRDVVLLAVPVDFHELKPAVKLFTVGGVTADDLIDDTGNVPPRLVREGIRMAKPTSDLVGYAGLWQNLHSGQFVEGYQVMVGWGTDHIPFPGAAFRQTVELLFIQNLLVGGKFPLGNRVVDLGSITCPVLNVTGDGDFLVPSACNAPLRSVLADGVMDDLPLATGHIGMVVGRLAHKHAIPAIAGWIEDRDTAVTP